MARKKHEEEHENLERWMVSYADFITLLFAFFVVMYAISSVNESKYKMLSSSIGIAFGGNVPIVNVDEKTPVSGVPGAKLPNRKERALNIEIKKEREKMTAIGHDLISTLSPLIKEGKVRVMQTARGVNVEINASVLFPPAESQLSAQSAQVLKAVGAVLKNSPNVIQVEGFTDNIPIRTASYPSNWELSAMRASSVVRLLIESGIDENRLVAIGRGSNQPIESNDTLDGRARNRRVQLMVLSAIPDEAKELNLKDTAESDGSVSSDQTTTTSPSPR